MIRRFICLLFFSILFAACSKSEPVTVQENPQKENSTTKLELIVEEEEDHIEEFIEFTLKEEIVTINIQAIPILQNYLTAVPDRNFALQQMNLIPIPIDDISIYVLEFSCLNDLCSYLLLDYDKNHEAYLMTDLAKLSQHLISPNQEYILFEFKRETVNSIPMSHIIPFSIEQWQQIPVMSKNKDITLNYTNPFSIIKWEKDDTILALKPMIDELTDESIAEWRQIGNPTEEFLFIIE